MSAIELNWAVSLACLLGWLAVVLPVVQYLHRGWAAKRSDILDRFSASDIQRYFKQFLPKQDLNLEPAALMQAMRAQYDELDGRGRFGTPLAVLALGSALGLFVVRGWVLGSLKLAEARPEFSAQSCAATLGGLIWVVWELLDRTQARDLRPRVVYECFIRLLIAVPLAYALSTPADTAFKAPLALALGAFPTKTMFTLLRRLGSKWMAQDSPDTGGEVELRSIQNVSQADAERLVDEGIRSISNLAWSDPVKTAVRTGLPFNFVTDCQGQALIWIYFQEQSKELYKLSLRGAVQVKNLVDLLNQLSMRELAEGSEEKRQLDGLEAVLTEASKAIGIDRAALWHTLEEITSDSYTILLCALWQDPVRRGATETR